MRRAKIATTAAFAGIMAAGFLAWAAGVRFNTSPSMPLGVWRHYSVPGHVYARGDIVLACPGLTEAQKAYLNPGLCSSGMEPVVKKVAGVGGDTINLSADGLRLNGVLIPSTAPLIRDGAGRPIEAFPFGVYTLPRDAVWLIAPRPDSFDSRYWGPVPVSEIQGLAQPLWVWR